MAECLKNQRDERKSSCRRAAIQVQTSRNLGLEISSSTPSFSLIHPINLVHACNRMIANRHGLRYVHWQYKVLQDDETLSLSSHSPFQYVFAYSSKGYALLAENVCFLQHMIIHENCLWLLQAANSFRGLFVVICVLFSFRHDFSRLSMNYHKYLLLLPLTQPVPRVGWVKTFWIPCSESASLIVDLAPTPSLTEEQKKDVF